MSMSESWSNLDDDETAVSAQCTCGAAVRPLNPSRLQLPPPLKTPPPESKPWWLVVVAIGVIGLVLG